MKKLMYLVTVLVILLGIFVSGCTIMMHEYGEGSVILMLGDQAYKVDATNDFDAAIKDLIPPELLKGFEIRSSTPVCYPQIEVNYNTPKREAE